MIVNLKNLSQTKFIAKDSEESGAMIYFADPNRDGYILRDLSTSYKIYDRVPNCSYPASYPGNYMIIGRYNNTEALMKNAMFALTSCPCSWNPTLRTIVILVDHNRRNQNEYEHVASELITRLWKRVVYDVVIIFRLETYHDQNSIIAYTANPFDENNDCGSRAMTLTLLHSCDNLPEDVDYGATAIWRHPKVYPNCSLAVSRRESPPFSFSLNGRWMGVDVRFVKILSKRKKLKIVWSQRVSSEDGAPLAAVHNYYIELAKRKIDLAIGGVILQNDYVHDVHYLRSYSQNMLKYYVASSDVLRGYDTIHLMFTGDIWLLLCSSIIIGGFCYNMLIESAFTFNNSKFFVMVAILSNQPIKLPKRWRLRLFLAAFLLSLYQISALYYSSIQSYIVQNPYGKNILTLEDLERTGMPVYASQTNLHLIDKAKNNYKNLITCNKSLYWLLENLNTQRNFSILTRNIGVEFWTQQKHYSIRPLIEGETVVSVTMALSKGSIYLSKIDDLVQTSLEAGLFLKWLGDLTVIRKNHTRSSNGLDPLSMEDVECAWILLVAGHSLACLAFCGEMLSVKWKKTPRIQDRMTRDIPKPLYAFVK
ncbi:Hypothetical protein NTJ_07416 [Nesidiocoris tenuis]|uniref:Ionotropic glutamate receptor C-terminal domain-containing protein n=1 Tax=Nesidiocoris tenuis TaxID=355587 RepID=A0ABN7ATD8_9HEMI|nr:Hypothetical protein NTJ_07416 [Nesidiocoris tenuis]